MQITPVQPAREPVSVEDSRPVDSAAGIASQVRLLNPRPVIDPAIGIVVTEYFNHAGDITEQYPAAKAIETYRIYGLHGDPNDTVPEG